MSSKILLSIMVVSIILVSGCTSQAGYTKGNLPAGVPATGETNFGNSIGDRAPDFTLNSTTGRMVKLSELTAQGKPVVLYFMATWCPFCKQEYEEIEKVFPGSGMEFISVSIDLNENSDMLEKYRTANNRPGLFAPGSETILKDYNVIYTTTKYVVSRDGKILYKGSGVLSADNWKVIFVSMSS